MSSGPFSIVNVIHAHEGASKIVPCTMKWYLCIALGPIRSISIFKSQLDCCLKITFLSNSFYNFSLQQPHRLQIAMVNMKSLRVLLFH